MSNPIQRPDLPKRFYQNVTVEEIAGGFEIRLDGRPVRTPIRNLLALPDHAIAEAVAAEWARQETHIDPATMPVTRLANTVLDGVANDPAATRDDLARYAETDLIAYRADEPERLVARQAEAWDPIVAWVEGAVRRRLATAAGVMHVAQDPATIAALRSRLAEETDPFRLAGIHQMTTLTGSLILALAVAEGRLDVAEAGGSRMSTRTGTSRSGATTRKRRPAAHPVSPTCARPTSSCVADQIPANHS